MDHYRPIETIPDEVKKRRKRVLLKFDTGPEEIGRWNAYMSRWQLDNGLFCNPVSWHPLPSDTDTSEVERLREALRDALDIAIALAAFYNSRGLHKDSQRVTDTWTAWLPLISRDPLSSVKEDGNA